MSTYFNVTTPVKGTDNKTRFHTVGVAFPTSEDSKAEMTIKLFATPINGELVLFAPKSGSDNSDGE